MEAIKISRSTVIAAERNRVWQALTRPDRFSTWFGGKVQFARPAVGEVMTFFEGEDAGFATIMTVQPPERFAFQWSPEPGYPQTTLVTFLLEVADAGTRVTVTEEGFEALPETVRQPRFVLNDKGWTIQLDNLTEYLRTEHDV